MSIFLLLKMYQERVKREVWRNLSGVELPKEKNNLRPGDTRTGEISKCDLTRAAVRTGPHQKGAGRLLYNQSILCMLLNFCWKFLALSGGCYL